MASQSESQANCTTHISLEEIVVRKGEITVRNADIVARWTGSALTGVEHNDSFLHQYAFHVSHWIEVTKGNAERAGTSAVCNRGDVTRDVGALIVIPAAAGAGRRAANGQSAKRQRPVLRLSPNSSHR